MKIHRLMAVAIALVAPVALQAQVPETRIVKTNQIPENPAKLIEIVGAPEPARTVTAAPIAESEDIVVTRNRSLVGLAPLGAPLPVRERLPVEEREREEARRDGGHKDHRR